MAMINLPKQLTIQVDTREKYPLPFPSNIRIPDPTDARRSTLINIITQSIKLDTGDYRLAEYPDVCVIERKASQLELAKNLLNATDSRRQAKAFARLSQCQYPYILLEVAPQQFFTPKSWSVPIEIVPEVLIHRFMQVIHRYGFHLIWVSPSSSISTRRNLGMTLLHIMVGHALSLDTIKWVPAPPKSAERLSVVPVGG